LLVLSDWDEFKALDTRRLTQAMQTPVIVDPLGVFSDIDFTHESVSYIPMGRARA
jgi:hypothetical protein